MPPSTSATGRQGEQLAVDHLVACGYRIVERNFRTRRSELDIVASDGAVTCFVEVRGRSSSRRGSAADTITRTKRRRIAKAAEVWLVRHQKLQARCRFDVVTVCYATAEVTLIRDAFRLDDC